MSMYEAFLPNARVLDGRGKELRGGRARRTRRRLRRLELAEAMTATRVDVPEPLFRALERELGAPGLVELAATIVWENHRARFNHTFGAESEGYAQGAFCAIPSPRALPPDSRSA